MILMISSQTAQLTYTLILFATVQGDTKKLTSFIIKKLLVISSQMTQLSSVLNSFSILHGDTKKLISFKDKTKCKILNVKYFKFE
jgi:hypothetical protein